MADAAADVHNNTPFAAAADISRFDYALLSLRLFRHFSMLSSSFLRCHAIIADYTPCFHAAIYFAPLISLRCCRFIFSLPLLFSHVTPIDLPMPSMIIISRYRMLTPAFFYMLACIILQIRHITR